MSYAIRFRPAAEREYLALRGTVRARIDAALGALARDPLGPGTFALWGSLRGRRKCRAGNHRIVYSVEHDVLVVRVIAVGHRSRVYEDAERRA